MDTKSQGRKAMWRVGVWPGALVVLFAGCYEIIGCTDNQDFAQDRLQMLGCEQLYDVRNRIFKDHGYCFSTAKAIERFGNDGCSIPDAAQVPLNDFERANVKAIRTAEQAMTCGSEKGRGSPQSASPAE
jgi:YARHG domain